jgi:Ca2+-binding EF-hand superfamily protein
MQVWEQDSKHAWIKDYHPAGVQALDAMDEIKAFAFGAFEALDADGDGFIDRWELEAALKNLSPLMRERSFVVFLLCHVQEIADAHQEECITRSDGISRSDLAAYFERYQKAPA